MAIYLTGDTHGGIDGAKIKSSNFPNYSKCTKDDYLIILGDWGYLFEYNPSNNEKDDTFSDLDDIPSVNNFRKQRLISERKRLHHEFTNRKFTTLVIFGNHENYDRIKNFPIIPMFGGTVRQISESVFELMRGQIYTIDGYKFFVFGGAKSIDRYTALREEGIDWFPEEESSYEEECAAIDTLKAHNNSVDFILTHTCAKSTLDELSKLMGFYIESYDRQCFLFEEIKNTVDYKGWLFGHFHRDLIINDKEMVLYNKIINIKDFDHIMS